MLITWYKDDGGDYGRPSLVMETEFITDKQLDDIKKLMKDFGIKRWVKEPQLVTLETYKDGDACLTQFRELEVRPIKVVESWSVFHDRTNS